MRVRLSATAPLVSFWRLLRYLLNSVVRKIALVFGCQLIVVPNVCEQGCNCISATQSLLRQYENLKLWNKSFGINTEINNNDCRMTQLVLETYCQ